MFSSLKLRFISVLIFIAISIFSLHLMQYNFSAKINHLFESQLALKELQVKYLQMEVAQIKFILTHDSKYIEDVQVYANTIDAYFGIVDEYLEEFVYPKEIEENLESYLEAFNLLAHPSSHHDITLQNTLHSHSVKLHNYIKDQQRILTPIITRKIETITFIQNLSYLIMAIVILFLLLVVFRPVIRAITIFKKFFSSYEHTKEKLNVEKLYFNEVKDIALFVNKMLEIQEKNQKEILISRDEALHSQKVKDEFLSNMSHELRTPLNAIGGFSGVLLRKLPHEYAIINPILDSSAHLLQLVSDILDLSKIQSGKFKIVEEPFELYEELLSLVERFSPLVAKKEISLRLNYKGAKDINLIGDWFRVAQILNNFMSNAIKFTPNKGKIELEVNYNDGIFYAGVKDSGIGIKAEALDNILKPFEQSDDTITKKFGGTGLGLSIAKTLTEMMQGTLDIQSQLNEGSTFSVSIPFKSILREISTVQENHEQNEEPEEILIEAHVLIAEDNKTNQLLLSMLLDDLEITYDIANDGQEAVDIFQENTYDLILMDENMPNLSGTEAMSAIREKFSFVPPIIAVTANAMKGDRQRLLELGMDDFLSKPIDNDLLIQTIKRNLKK